METTRLSTKGQVILPKAVRDARAWLPGTMFAVEETPEGVLLRPLRRFRETRLEEVVGCLKYVGTPATVEEMDQAIALEIKTQHDTGRY
ncbi:MAG TPA: AbrB/MazE/SpoVT family DNA-binding domain-containing protein [Bryobacteraceae bacterium]|jgi:AbrB family looped-hinge helix DNA binding protein